MTHLLWTRWCPIPAAHRRSKLKLQDKLDAFTADLINSGKIPGPIVTQLMDGIKEQIASGKADGALVAGETAPTFTLKDPAGASVSSATLLARGPLVVSFYRGVWCPYCNLELQALEAARADIEARGASLVAISMQNAANSRKSVRENELRFPILIDAGGDIAAEFGLRYRLSPQMIELNKALGNNLEVINSEDSWSLPMPGRYVIGQDGIIAYAEVNPDYTHRPDPGDLFPILDQLARARAA
jgi:peroxiredoxin